MSINVGQLKFKERRMSERKVLTGLLPGKLFVLTTGEVINCKPVDLSQHGIGILSSHQLEPGISLGLQIQNETITLIITWRKNDFAKHDLYRYGLTTKDSEHDLFLVFESSGMFREEK